MRAYGIRRYGSNDVIELLDVPTPKLGVGDVLIRIEAASINPVDLKIRQGALKAVSKFSLPLVLGNDCSGVVSAVGANVTRFKPGDEVFARTDKERIGTFAEFIAVKETAVALKPANLSFTEAAALPLVALTSWQVMFDQGHLSAGQKVFIPAGSGGVGTVAIQLAKSMGAYVATTTSTKNIEMVKQLGADEVIDYKSQDFSQILKDFDLVFDTLGGDDQAKAFEILKPGGNLISIVGPPTPKFAKEAQLHAIVEFATYFLSRRVRGLAKKHQVNYAFYLMHPSGTQLEKIAAMVEKGQLKPTVDRVFPFGETPSALAYVETGRAKGKVVISMAPQPVS
jgi:NADPH:quinone reductase-like Zn-dependent oxidoreductase